ncbi:flagellar biosynthetic protein FliO [Endozoicomonas sp. SM1973]|uniref:Flagellar protein n=1 Tax=Spartinivicinus marinus TaxID=2994442 RepID=A0A853I8D1_9GAMM|nr:flagellar biosynthetic protein FliO [Spartinivicinus marinus]MCX4028922.1 flagellar biosynthetic protein FliO [Spartinivicinus marinus]NYZ65495.1 flagellar biosynthetic protein FliO [Spartinivicinus marinus]
MLLVQQNVLKSFGKFAVISLGSFFCQWGWAAEKTKPDDGLGISALAQVALSLLLVIAAIAGLAWLVKKMQHFQPMSQSSMQVVASLALGPRDRVLLVQVGEQQVLLGASPGRINMLHVFSEPVIDANSTPAAGTDFSNTLAKLLKQKSS